MRDIDLHYSGSSVHFKSHYEDFIGGTWVPPAGGQYFQNTSISEAAYRDM